MKIKKLFMLCIASFLLFTLITIGVFLTQKTKKETLLSAQQQSQSLLDEAYLNLEIIDDLMSKRVEAALNLLLKEAQALGSPQIKNEFPIQTTSQTAKGLYLGDELINNNFKLVDQVLNLTEATATLFVKDNNEFIRIATNVKTANNQRALGTKLNMQGAAGKSLAKGVAYFGQVDILGQPYLTAYSPLNSAQQETLGIAYVGYPADLSSLYKSIETTALFNQGFSCAWWFKSH